MRCGHNIKWVNSTMTVWHLWNWPQMNPTYAWWWWVTNDLSNVFLRDGNKPFPDPTFIQVPWHNVSVTAWTKMLARAHKKTFVAIIGQFSTVFVSLGPEDLLNSLAPGRFEWNFRTCLNSLAPGRFEWNFRKVIFKLILLIDGWTLLMIRQHWFR